MSTFTKKVFSPTAESVAYNYMGFVNAVKSAGLRLHHDNEFFTKKFFSNLVIKTRTDDDMPVVFPFNNGNRGSALRFEYLQPDFQGSSIIWSIGDQLNKEFQTLYKLKEVKAFFKSQICEIPQNIMIYD